VSANEHSNTAIGDATITRWSQEIDSTDRLFTVTLMSAQSEYFGSDSKTSRL